MFFLIEVMVPSLFLFKVLNPYLTRKFNPARANLCEAGVRVFPYCRLFGSVHATMSAILPRSRYDVLH